MRADMCAGCGCQLFVVKSELVLVPDETEKMGAFERMTLTCKNEQCAALGRPISHSVALEVAEA